jgi:predicted RNA-binding Zn-ribbon protein involved in translation (DUF1610 family)
MKIKQINYQNRRDFYADYECENCGNIEHNMRGYDDSYFHTHVIPSMRCSKCGESANSLGTDYRPLTTKYPDGFQI